MKNMNSICTFQMDVSFSDFSVSGGFCKAFISQVWDLPRKFPRQFPSVMRWSLIGSSIVFPFFGCAAKVHSCRAGHCGTFEKDEHLLLQRKNGCLLYVKRWIQGRGFFRGFSGSRFKTLEPQLRRCCEESEEIEEFN